MNLRDCFESLETIYRELPDLQCLACGQCCVEPHFSLLEFTYLVNWIIKDEGDEGVVSLMQTPYKESKWHPGDPACPVQTNMGQCGRYRGRGLSCRLEGFPALESVLGRNEPVCPNHQLVSEKPTSWSLSGEVMVTLADRLRSLNENFYSCNSEPWFCYFLPLQTWWSVVYDPDIIEDYWLGLRSQILGSLSIAHLSTGYMNYTQLSEMIVDIRNYTNYVELGKISNAKSVLEKILTHYSRCGDYYQREGQIQLSYMNNKGLI